jgi:hypothetical protein
LAHQEDIDFFQRLKADSVNARIFRQQLQNLQGGKGILKINFSKQATQGLQT